MKQALFNEDQTPRCEYCKNGNLSPTGREVLCRAKGIVDLSYSCKKYVYDPLKRQPKKMSADTGYSAADFEL